MKSLKQNKYCGTINCKHVIWSRMNLGGIKTPISVRLMLQVASMVAVFREQHAPTVKCDKLTELI